MNPHSTVLNEAGYVLLPARKSSTRKVFSPCLNACKTAPVLVRFGLCLSFFWKKLMAASELAWQAFACAFDAWEEEGCAAASRSLGPLPVHLSSV